MDEKTATGPERGSVRQEEAAHLSNEVLIKEYEGHFANYAEYSKTYRNWMVAYGVGGPVLLLTNEQAAERLVGAPQLPWIVGIFLAGVGLQILLAFVNKWVAWCLYGGAFSRYQHAIKDPEATKFHESRAYRFSRAAGAQSWFDFLIDLSAPVCYSIATSLAMYAAFRPAVG